MVFFSEVEPSLALSHDNFLASNTAANSSAAATTNRPGSPPEYKMFNNNESRDHQEVKTTVRPSPDSGLAISEAMSNSGSPAGAGGGHAGQPTILQPQGSPIPGANLVVRPQPARSPYEWMKRPATGMQSRPKEGELISIFSVANSQCGNLIILLKFYVKSILANLCRV